MVRNRITQNPQNPVYTQRGNIAPRVLRALEYERYEPSKESREIVVLDDKRGELMFKIGADLDSIGMDCGKFIGEKGIKEVRL